MDLRCFIAVEIPLSVTESIARVTDDLKKTGGDVRWVRPDNIHLTIKFLGQTDESIVPAIKNALLEKLVPYQPFYITIAGAGYFPDNRRPRIIWIGIEPEEQLPGLLRDVEETMFSLGFPREKKPFSGHLTIGRVRSPRRIFETVAVLDTFTGHCFGSVEVNKIDLMSSILKPAGAEYSTLAEIPFGRRKDVG